MKIFAYFWFLVAVILMLGGLASVVVPLFIGLREAYNYLIAHSTNSADQLIFWGIATVVGWVVGPFLGVFGGAIIGSIVKQSNRR